MKRLLLLTAATLFFFTSRLASQERTCASHEMLLQQMADDPVFAAKVRQNERFISVNETQRRGQRVTVTKIPVVVHVVWNTTAQKISLDQIESQIDVLNEDFNATNSDFGGYFSEYDAAWKGDANYQFCLAKVIYMKTKKKSFGTDNSVKFTSRGGSDVFEPNHYLNIWVCNLGQSLLGYAQFPDGNPSTDGVVIQYKGFGRNSGSTNYTLFSNYDLGRTATHEIGHWVGLRHIWGDATCGNDFVAHTPLHNAANYGCPGVDHRSTCTGTPLEMWMNYMDYTYDACMYTFTDDQVTRMDYYFDNSRTDLVTFGSTFTCPSSPVVTELDNTGHGGGGNGGGNPHNRVTTAISVYPTITSSQLTIKLFTETAGTVQLNFVDVQGRLVSRQTLAVMEGENVKSVSVQGLSNGVYLLNIINGTNTQSRKIVVQH